MLPSAKAVTTGTFKEMHKVAESQTFLIISENMCVPDAVSDSSYRKLLLMCFKETPADQV